MIAQEFRSGLWVKDERNFVNVTQVLPDSVLVGVKIYEFDADHRLRRISLAQRGEYQQNNKWRLHDVEQTNFDNNTTTISKLAEADWRSVLEPGLLSVLLLVPEQMSACESLLLRAASAREQAADIAPRRIAFWNKLLYPLAICW